MHRIIRFKKKKTSKTFPRAASGHPGLVPLCAYGEEEEIEKDG